MVTGITVSVRLKMADWNCSRNKLAKIECGLITVRDHNLPHFLNAFTIDIGALYPALPVITKLHNTGCRCIRDLHTFLDKVGVSGGVCWENR